MCEIIVVGLQEFNHTHNHKHTRTNASIWPRTDRVRTNYKGMPKKERKNSVRPLIIFSRFTLLSVFQDRVCDPFKTKEMKNASILNSLLILIHWRTHTDPRANSLHVSWAHTPFILARILSASHSLLNDGRRITKSKARVLELY